VDFRHVSAKIYPKNLKQHIVWGVRAPWATPWLNSCPRLQKTFPDRKNQASYAGFAQSCRNNAGNRKKLGF